MSDEYEYEDDERKPRMTFGQILASLLLLGVLVVIGLIVLVYFKLTSPVERAHTAPIEASAPIRAVERITPDGKPAPALSPVAPDATVAANNMASHAAKAADEAVNRLQSNTADNAPVEGLNNAALAGGAAAGVAAAQLKKQREAAAARRRAREQQRAAAANGENPVPRRSRSNNTYNEGEEIPLQPIQRGERRLTPRNSNNSQSGERELTPRNNQGERPLAPRRNQSAQSEQPQRPIRLNPPAEQRERPLTPTRPQGGNKSEINELF